MKQNRIEEGRFTQNAHGLGTVSEAMVRQRAKEIALISGRSEVLDHDLDQAWRELTGHEGLVPDADPEELIPEENRAPDNHGSVGQRVEAVPAPDEQTFAETLVEEGVQDAEHDQMVKATRNALNRDKDGSPEE